MNADAKKIIEDFLNLNGTKTENDFRGFMTRIATNYNNHPYDYEAMIKLTYVFKRIEHGLRVTKQKGPIDVNINDTEKDIEDYFNKSLPDINLGKMPPVKRRKKRGAKDLGKLVDEGEVPTSKSRADGYWKERAKVIFTPTNKTLRNGAPIPKGYAYDDMDYLIDFYGLKAIEFGNWLSQQDRKNYVSALGLALFDLHKVLGFDPKDISVKKKITIAFGARGRGSALAHFESDTFAINITRYRRPKKGSTKTKGFDRTGLLIASGGVGTFAHEYGHALDYFAGKFLEPDRSGAVSGGRSVRITTHKQLLKKSSITALMEKLLDKIIWQSKGEHSAYYSRLISDKNIYKITDYHLYRNELFARAFEVYVHSKMQKKNCRNIFLAETKYDPHLYLTLNEMKKLEKDFDALISAIKRRL